MNHFLYIISIILFVTHTNFASLVNRKPQTTMSSQELIKRIQDRDRSWFDKINPLSTHQKDKITAIDNYLKIIGQEKHYVIAGGNVGRIDTQTAQAISPAELEAALDNQVATITRGKQESTSETVAKLLDVAQKIRIEREQAAQKLTSFAKAQIIAGGMLTTLGIGATLFTIFSLTNDGRDDYNKWAADLMASLGSTAGGGWMIYQGWSNPGAQAEYAKAAQTELHLIQKFNEFAKQEQEEKSQKKVENKKKKKSKQKIRAHNLQDFDRNESEQ